MVSVSTGQRVLELAQAARQRRRLREVGCAVPVALPRSLGLILVGTASCSAATAATPAAVAVTVAAVAVVLAAAVTFRRNLRSNVL